MKNLFDIKDYKDIKFTQSRKKIIKLFNDSLKPICYDDIKNDLKMDKATFYRNINSFEKKDIINSIQSNNKRYFEINQKDNHCHFICNICQEMTCIKKQLHIYIKHHQIDSIILNGKCSNCI